MKNSVPEPIIFLYLALKKHLNVLLKDSFMLKSKCNSRHCEHVLFHENLLNTFEIILLLIKLVFALRLNT